MSPIWTIHHIQLELDNEGPESSKVGAARLLPLIGTGPSLRRYVAQTGKSGVERRGGKQFRVGLERGCGILAWDQPKPGSAQPPQKSTQPKNVRRFTLQNGFRSWCLSYDGKQETMGDGVQTGWSGFYETA